jgi:pyruvate dehydrogenase (quinone)
LICAKLIFPTSDRRNDPLCEIPCIRTGISNLGTHGIHVEGAADLEGAIKETLAHDGPVFGNVMTAKQELVMPPKIQLEQAKGLSLYMLKAIVNGRGDEPVELVQTNLRR